MRLEVAFAEQNAVVVEGALEKEESGERLPGELCFGGEADPSTKLRAGAGPVQEEGTRGDQLLGGGAATGAEMPGEPAVDGGHAAGEVELAVEVAGGAEGEGGWRLAVGGWRLGEISRQLAVGSRQLAVGSRQLAEISRQLAVGSRQFAVEETGKILPGDAEGQLEEDALDEEAGIGTIDMAPVFPTGIQFLTEGFESLSDERPLGVGYDGAAYR
jgi:hypothetical protein